MSSNDLNLNENASLCLSKAYPTSADTRGMKNTVRIRMERKEGLSGIKGED